MLLTHKKPEATAAQRDGGIAMNAIPGRQVPRTRDGKINESEGSLVEGRAEDQVMWDVGEASDDEDEHVKLNPRPESLANAGHGEEGEHLMSSTLDDGDNAHLHTVTGAKSGRTPARRRSSSTLQRKDEDDRDGFGDFAEG